MPDHSVILIIGGGIAACKSLELIRLLRRENVAVRCILTQAGAQFVTPLSVASLSGNPPHTDLFDAHTEAEISHIELSRRADLLIVCPATADLMAKAAQGLAPDLATTTLLATHKPVLMIPAMNLRMWQHPATRRNVRQLREDGIEIMSPDCGEMACGEFGAGRLPEPTQICAHSLARLNGQAPQTPALAGLEDTPYPDGTELAGKRAIITAGPTREWLDPVRFLSNASSGRQGFALAAALKAHGADVVLVSGPTETHPPAGIKTIHVTSAREMLHAVETALPADIFVGVAAIADWRPETISDHKLKFPSKDQMPPLNLTANPDILHRVAVRTQHRPALVVGFAAETHNTQAHARAKLLAKGCDWMVANTVCGDTIGGDNNQIDLLTRLGDESWPSLRKSDVSMRLVGRMVEYFSAHSAGQKQKASRS